MLPWNCAGREKSCKILPYLVLYKSACVAVHVFGKSYIRAYMVDLKTFFLLRGFAAGPAGFFLLTIK